MLAHAFQRGMRSHLMGQVLLFFPYPPSPNACNNSVRGAEVHLMNWCLQQLRFHFQQKQVGGRFGRAGQDRGKQVLRGFVWSCVGAGGEEWMAAEHGDEVIWARKDQTCRNWCGAWSCSGNQRLDCYIWQSQLEYYWNSVLPNKNTCTYLLLHSSLITSPNSSGGQSANVRWKKTPEASKYKQRSVDLKTEVFEIGTYKMLFYCHK